jgi:tripartite-type tricarboxylate transporter receptor subunit TctC
LLKLRTGISIVHVPYKGGGPAVADTMSGQVPLLFLYPRRPRCLSLVPENCVHSLSRRARRTPAAPVIPTVAEELNLPDYEVDSWCGDVRAGENVRGDRSRVCSRRPHGCLQLPDVKQKFVEQGATRRQQPGGARARGEKE